MASASGANKRAAWDPVGQRRAVQLQTGARVDLRLAVQQRVVAVFADEHVSQHAGA